MRSMVAAAGGAPAVSTRTPRRTSRRSSSGALAMPMSTVGAAHSMRDAFSRRSSANIAAGSTLRRQTCVAAHRRHDPHERPAVGVEHRQRPQVAVGERHGRCTSVPTTFIQALRCVIITPFGREVVPLV